MGKFTVIKNEDMKKYLNIPEIYLLMDLVATVENERTSDGKPNNKYAIINLDEPYADEVINIMRANGHWGDYEWQEDDHL